MNRNVISAKQMRSLVSLFLIGSALITGSSGAKQDTWVCVIAGFLLSIPLMLVHAGILDLYPGRNYFDNILKIYGRVGGRIVVAILSLYALHLAGNVLRTSGEFIRVVNMTETPLVAIAAFMVGVSVFLLENRVRILARVSKFVLPIVILSVSFTALLSCKDMNFDNIKPVFGSGLPNIMNGTLLYLILPFGELVVCVPVFEGLERKRRIFPILFMGALSGFLVILVANLRNLLVLGYSSQIFSFASYEAVSVIAYGEFFTRIEVLIGINLLLAGFAKISILIYSSAVGFAKLFAMDDYVPFIAPCGLLALTVTLMTHANTDEMFGWLTKYLPVYLIPLQVVIPVLTLLIGVIRKKAKGKGTGKRARAPRKEAGKTPEDEAAPQS